ncbi:hypothetical protein ABZS86_02360 [Streptomyces sp. NPDC005355]|uniref:hypothetical protein n=1 Tax=Streptomyces sp. NPDC005355 TaxID=3157038 RepID=UPI0033A33A14
MTPPEPPDGVTVVVPRQSARELERVLAAGLLAVYRADGGRPSPAAERLLRDLHEAARRPAPPAAADVGSEDPPAVTVEITVAEAAASMGCRPRWIRYLLAAGLLRGRRASARLWLIDSDSLDEYRHGRAHDSNTTTEQG